MVSDCKSEGITHYNYGETDISVLTVRNQRRNIVEEKCLLWGEFRSPLKIT